MNKIEWECFCDESYYGLWAVRPKGEKRWGYCFHLHCKEEAEDLTALLTLHNVPWIEQKDKHD